MPETDEPVEYDLTDWTNQARALLTRCLEGEEISHDWVAGTLQVDPHHEERVDILVDEIDELAGVGRGDGDDKVEVVGGDDIPVEPDVEAEPVMASDDDEADQDDDETADETDETGGSTVAEGDQIGYDNDEWDSGTRAMLSSLLRAEQIPFAWEATTLVVNARDEAQVDVLVEQVEVSTLAALDPLAPKVIYELEGWSEEQRASLAGELLSANISHDWDADDNLVVLEDDEAAVDPLVDVIDDGTLEADDEEEDDEVDGLAAQDAMSDLFLAADRLLHDPSDGGAAAKLRAAVGRVELLPVPYGFSPTDWQRIVDRSADLRSMVDNGGTAVRAEDETDEVEPDADAGETDAGETDADETDADETDADETDAGDQTDDEAVVEAATALRNMLRSYV